MSPVISIIVPVYNVEKYLKRCIESIIYQTYKDFEVILINDGSTDRSGLICDEYSKIDKRIKVVHKRNEGVSSARNCGIDSTRGKYILFIDSDDYIEKNLLKIISEALEEEYDLIYFGYYMDFISENRSLEMKCRNSLYYSNKDFLKDYKYFRGNYLFGYVWNKLFRAEVIKNNNIYFEINTFPEDLFFTFEAIKKCNKIKSLNYSLYHYIHRNNLTLSKQKRDKYEITKTIYKRTVGFLKELDCYNINAAYVEGTHIEDLISYIYSELMSSDNKLMHKYKKIKIISNELRKQNKNYYVYNNNFYKIAYNLLKFKLIWGSIFLYYLYQGYTKLKSELRNHDS